MTKTYEVVATREGKWWAIAVTGLRMGFSQARRLSDVDAMAREAISILTRASEDSFNIKLRIDIPEAEAVATAERLRAQAEEAKCAADQAKRAAALLLVERDISVRDVATMLHVSPGWVSVLTNTSEKGN